MLPGPFHPDDLPASMTRLYFRVAVPLVALATLWNVLLSNGRLNPAALTFLGVLLLTAAAHQVAPPRWEWGLRVAFASLLVLFALVLGTFREALGVPPHLIGQGIDIVLLLAPVTVLAWSFLFADQPRVGALLSLAFALAVTFLVDRWNGGMASPGTALLLLAVCLIVQTFGGAVVNLQRRVLLGEQQVRLDPLTGLLNRRAFEEVLSSPGPPGILAVVDVDHFKQVNDRYGHDVGDEVLRLVAQALQEAAGDVGEVYRWGGEEFVVWLPGLSVMEAHALLEDLRCQVARQVRIGAQSVTISIGLSVSESNQPPGHAFGLADTALRAAKASGRDQVRTAPMASAV